MHYLLFYEVGEDYVSRRAEFRDAHLEKAWKASKRGELVLSGAFANPVNGVERASEYVLHATKKVFPALRAIDGHRGAYLLRRMVDGAIEFVVLTLWDSMATARRFAGAEPEKAVVDAEARAILTSFDERVTHYEIVQELELAQDEHPSRS